MAWTAAGAPAWPAAVSVADQAWALLLQVGFELVAAHFAAAVAELDLAPAQARALHELDLDRPISMRELAERLKSDPSNVTGLIDRLEARGLVERRPDPTDRRIKGLALTPAGAQLRAAPVRAPVFGSAVSGSPVGARPACVAGRLAARRLGIDTRVALARSRTVSVVGDG